MSRDPSVREPHSESADPFGDFPLFDDPPEADRARALRTVDPSVYAPAPPPTSDSYEPPEGFEPEPGPGQEGGGWFGGLMAAGAARLIGVGIAIAIATSGFGLFQANVGNDGPPNVPSHVLDACYEALAVTAPAGVSYGAHHAYEQSGTDSLVRFRATDGSSFTCRWNAPTFTASIEDIVPAG